MNLFSVRLGLIQSPIGFTEGFFALQLTSSAKGHWDKLYNYSGTELSFRNAIWTAPSCHCHSRRKEQGAYRSLDWSFSLKKRKSRLQSIPAVNMWYFFKGNAMLMKIWHLGFLDTVFWLLSDSVMLVQQLKWNIKFFFKVNVNFNRSDAVCNLSNKVSSKVVSAREVLKNHKFWLY